MPSEHSTEEWLTEPYDYQRPRRGQIRKGIILRLEEEGVIIDVGLKRDGFVPQQDVARLGKEAASQLEPGQEVTTRIVHPRDREGNLILSLYQARQEKDWAEAQELLENGQVFQGKVTDSNRGGLLVKFGHIQGFVPASHLQGLESQHLPAAKRLSRLKTYVGQELFLKVIEVDRNRRRLILSERLARRQLRRQNMKRLLNELVEGQVIQGTVSRLCNFGAFVDLGGADGLIHLSELAWRRVRHPGEVVQVGDEIEVYVLRLDRERQRIGLSLKRLQPSPWDLAEEAYGPGQLVSGVVTNVVNFGAFVLLDTGVEGLVHVSELAHTPPSDPHEIVQGGDELVLRILRVDAFRQRISLSLKRVSAQERDEWLIQQARDQTAETSDASDASPDNGDTQPVLIHTAEKVTSLPEQAADEPVLEASPPTPTDPRVRL
ncbi:MAG: S1 RNA-binding domain-containing protein [Anaerolineae bacterium]|nr:MAG: S1 RNA-binding domain-containing protein [Anaerolineae bacterium]